MIEIYKFGGAIIKDEYSIKNIINIIKNNKINKIIIISAIKNITNILEKLIYNIFFNNKFISYLLNKIYNIHIKIIKKLFNKNHIIFNIVELLLLKLYSILNFNIKYYEYNFIYDQIICFGELISTKIISEFLKYKNINNIWLDVRNYIITNNLYKYNNVNWKSSLIRIKSLSINKYFYITQGYIASNEYKYSTTLGRNGSDYTASIFSYCLDAGVQTVWKDVYGIMDINPKISYNHNILNYLTYYDVIEMSINGAYILHSKAINPLRYKNIKLNIKSYLDINSNHMSIISNKHIINKKIRYYLVKCDQILLYFKKTNTYILKLKDIIYILNIMYSNEININFINIDLSMLLIIIDNINDYNLIYNIFLSIPTFIKLYIKFNISLHTLKYYNINDVLNCILNKRVIHYYINDKTMKWILLENKTIT